MSLLLMEYIAKSDATLLHLSKNTALIQKSTASIHGLSLKETLIQSTTAYIEAMPHRFPETFRLSVCGPAGKVTHWFKSTFQVVEALILPVQ